MDKKEAISVYQRILEKYPDNMEAYFHYWDFLVKAGDIKKLEKVSENMMQAAQNTTVPTSDWMKAHSIRARTLIMLNRHKEAIKVLKRQVHVIPPLAIPGLSYFKDGEIIISETSVEDDSPFTIGEDAENYSNSHSQDDGYKYSVGRSSKPHKPDPLNDPEHSSFRSVKRGRSNKEETFEDNHRFSFNETAPMKPHHAHSKSNVPKAIKPLTLKEEVHHEIEGFSVSTDVDFLYQIGKICAESGIKAEEGIQSLNDFCLILDYYHQDMDEKVYLKMKTQAKFYIGVCYFRLKNLNATEIVLRQILTDLEEIETEDGPRYKETEKILRRCFRERLLYEVELYDDYFYPADDF